MAEYVEPKRLSDILKDEQESPRGFSREKIIVASGQELILGEVYSIKTTDGKAYKLAPGGTGGVQTAAGIATDDYDATAGDVPGVGIARNAYMVSSQLEWPEGITDAQKVTALGKLKTLGILPR